MGLFSRKKRRPAKSATGNRKRQGPARGDYRVSSKRGVSYVSTKGRTRSEIAKQVRAARKKHR